MDHLNGAPTVETKATVVAIDTRARFVAWVVFFMIPTSVVLQP
jgi:hypothetical protein